jgi:hypothetical protein
MIADINQTPLKINISFDNFLSIYRDVHNHPEPALEDKLIAIMKVAFAPWVFAWTQKQYATNINIASLYNLLKADDKPVADISWKIESYNNYLSFHEITFEEELVFCLLQHIKKPKYVYRRYKRPKNFLFFIAKDIKMFLFKKIRAVLFRVKRNNNFLIPLAENKSYYDSILDTEYLHANPLHMNILLLILENKTTNEVLRTLHISHANYKEAIKCLLQSLKQSNK